jgi:hypothetical protein
MDRGEGRPLMVGNLLRRFRPEEPLAHTAIALYELPMQYPSVRWRQLLPPAPQPDAGDAVAVAAREEWLARTAILLLEAQLPLLTRELQGRLVTRLDEFVEYRMGWDKFGQQAPLREEGGLLLAELDARIVAGRPPGLRTHFDQRMPQRTAFSLLATLLDGFTTDTIRAMPPPRQSWACLWLTYLIQWYTARGPADLAGRASRHPQFFRPGGVPEERDFPRE